MNRKHRCMYNEDLKKKYIAYAVLVSESDNLESTERGIKNRFFRSERLESQIGKDICEFNELDAKSFLKQFLNNGELYQMNTLSTLRAYTDWAMKNRFTTIDKNPFRGIKVSDIDIAESYEDTMVSDENDLIHSLETALCDIELDTADNFRWCVFLLIFAGIPFKNIFYIKTEDVDLNNRTIQFGSEMIHITDGLYRVLQHYINMDELQKTGKNDTEYGKPIIHEGYLLSNTKKYGLHRDKMRLSCASDISQAMKECSKKLKPGSIHDSGIFYRMFLKEQETGEVDCLEYLRARKTQSAVINFPDRMKKICKSEYETWKRAFGL